MVCDQHAFEYSITVICLNPYSIGIWSATYIQLADALAMGKVLILILLEYGLRRACKRR